ncbi:flagellar M-ring protein FliF [Arthrobacter sp. MSA 4-2]|uniref:flagellar basal-body MS-ring/collar protein FliF n=1 Tax=Arthrobacter sp. MSA 4-2 TaxID=2794349 RepID=UPI0018E6EE2A|nr:flagellar basal-body MS-ring/collar protein FliF [Arthrobacter sp. MSA 4-2]MBJ2120586.1 flagellar M-ring protein FliF [Arthrobacter sp. MSA 4-2]
MASLLPASMSRVAGTMKEFSLAQKTLALLGVAVLVLGSVLLTSWLTKPAYTPLFSGLQAEDASIIVEQLRTDGVPYEITSGGSTILVPEANVYDQRLKAASAGLPSESTGGYSLLDDMGVTSSEFQQSVTYKRALEGELAATIEGMEGVKTASVQLAIPEATVFTKEKADPTASVFVETRSAAELSDDQVQAIVHLTSASLEGMQAKNVAVIDSRGTVLSAVGVGATGSSDKQASNYEQRVSGAVQAMLDRVVGPGNATVAVAADMNNESGERLEETFTTPEDAPALNESTTTETYTGTGGGGAGVLGPDNIAVPDGGNGDGTFDSETSTRNNALNKTTETTAIPAGSLNRQTVSVALDAEAARGLDLAALTGLVNTAAGIDEERGDAVAVEVLPFNTAGADEAAAALAEAKAAEADARNAELLRTGFYAIGAVLLVLVLVIVFAVRNRRQRRELIDLGERPLAAPFELDLPAVTPIEPAPTTSSIGVVLPSAPAPVAPAEPAAAELARNEIESLAARDPKKTADYLRDLMDEKVPV